MTDQLEHIEDVPVFVLGADGPALATENDALDLIVAAGHYGADAKWAAVPASRLCSDFFTLSTGFAGMMAQKFTSYGVGLVILGDVSGYASKPFQDWVRETNKGRHVWFARDKQHLAELLRG
ncbi:DUF4180 domain-containing protein [Kibdelosporangium aridum]|uniref:DUF4180 domain-containing protein n=1 Tax=Kibdelosporangium aridum TaxID=2030 RepID=UPI000525E2C1